jgi:hypothetical protein
MSTSTRWQWWVGLWDHREHPRVLGLIRLLVGGVLFYDFFHIGQLGLAETLWAAPAEGGISNVMDRSSLPLILKIFPASVATAKGLHFALCVSAFCFAVGCFTRVSGVIFLLLYAQSALIIPLGDRGIDLLMRNVVFLLLFSQCGAWGSVDAKRKTGSWFGSGTDVPAWPRHLLILQLVVMYFAAGVQKVGMDWMPMGDFSALYVVLHDPAVVRAGFSEIESLYFLTQMATATTMLFEWSALSLLLVYHYRVTPDRPGRLRRASNRWNFHWYWIGIGVLIHIGIAFTMSLGIFAYAMLALYPAFFHPDEVLGFWNRCRNPRGKKIIEGPVEV